MLLEPHATLTLHVAMVRRKDHDGVVGEAGFIEHVHDPSDMVVDIADHAVIAMARTPAIIDGHRELVAALTEMQVAAEVIHLVEIERGDGRRFDVVGAIAVPIFLADHIG